MRRSALFLLVLGLVGCSVDHETEKPNRVEIALPTDRTLPDGFNDGGCECLEGGNCATFAEQQLGYIEVKDTSCKRTTASNEVDCEYKSRFVAGYPAKDGKTDYVPEAWGKGRMITKHLGHGAWCVLEFKF